MTTLGLDLGTGSVKAAAVSDEGVIRARAQRAYDVMAPRPGWAESDPDAWLEMAISAAEEVLALQPVTAVGFSGQMHGVVVADAALRPLRPAIVWADSRAVAEATSMRQALAPEAIGRLGSMPVPGFAATTLAWLGRHEPDVMARATHVLQPKDWLRAALGGTAATDPSDASGTLLYDVVAGEWSTAALEWLGMLGRDLPLPAVLPSTDPAGAVTLGRWELPAVVGGADTACAGAALGLGPGEGFLAVGTGAQVVRALDGPHVDPTLGTHTFAAVGAPGQGWYRLGAVQSAGLVVDRALAWLGATPQEAEAALADGLRLDDPVFAPFLAGERTPFMDAGLRGSWHRLGLVTDRPALLRSVLEGVAQAVALAVQALADSGAPMPTIVPLVGGGAEGARFRQLLADATGLALRPTSSPDASVRGAALLAAGRLASPRQAAGGPVIAPQPDVADLLRERREMMVRLVERSAEETS